MPDLKHGTLWRERHVSKRLTGRKSGAQEGTTSLCPAIYRCTSRLPARSSDGHLCLFFTMHQDLQQHQRMIGCLKGCARTESLPSSCVLEARFCSWSFATLRGVAAIR